MAGMRQEVGAETVWKNRSHTRRGLVRFFQIVYAQQMGADRPFLFRISGSKKLQYPTGEGRRAASAKSEDTFAPANNHGIFPAGFPRPSPLCSAPMFDTIKSGITTATEKLTHLRRFL